jgi:hypothetical protein
MKTTKVILCVLLFLSFILQGCVLLAIGTGAAAGAGAVAYIKGELQTTYGASLDQTYQATLDALEDLDYRILSTQKDGTEGEIEAKRVGGDSVKVKLSVSGRGTTLVKIRVGIFGDEAASRTIERKIASRLEF